MAGSYTKTIKAPLGGINGTATFQQQPPNTCYDALDFWGYDLLGRRRVSTRPGWAELGSISDANSLGIINTADGVPIPVAITSDGTLYRWDVGVWTSVGSGMSTTFSLPSAPFAGRLYFGNYDIGTAKYFNSATNSLSNWTASPGDVPTGRLLTATWANRIILGRTAADTRTWAMSRVDDPHDWEFGEEDVGSAVAGSEMIGGQFSEPLTAFIPHNNECLIMCSATSMRVLRGNPMSGGRMETISNVLGPLHHQAWCRTADDWTYMMTYDGLYKMQPGCGDAPIPVRRNLSLLNQPSDIANPVVLGYDVQNRAVHISSRFSADYWVYDIDADAYWKFSLPGATACIAMQWYSGVSQILMAPEGLGTYYLSNTQAIGNTDGYFELGPFQLSQNRHEKGQITRATVVFGDNTNDTTGTVTFYAAEDGEAAAAKPASRSYATTIAACANSVYPRVGGHAGLVRIDLGLGTKHISFEEVSLDIVPSGRERK